MSNSQSPASRGWNPVSGLSELLDHVVMPPSLGRDLPRASVATWVTSHFAAVAVYATALLVGSASEPMWQTAVVIVWLVTLSGLCGRLVGRLVTTSSSTAPVVPARPRRYTPDLKLGLFIGFAYAAYIAAGELGAFAIGGFVSVLALTTGLRLAGLDAWAGRIREPWFYARSVFSIGGLIVFVALLTVSGLVFAAAFRVDPYLRSGGEAAVSSLTRAEQYRVLVLGILILTPPVLAVCEAIAAASRHEAALNDRLAGQERRLERDGIARDIHDGVILSTLGEVRKLSVSEEQTKLINGLEGTLRRLQVERLAARQDRSIRSCLRRPLHHANDLGLKVRLQTDEETLAVVVPSEAAMLIERLVMIQINNSAEAGAQSAEVGITIEAEALRLGYSDDGEGFDPELVGRTSGGLARLRFDIERLGGSLSFTRRSQLTFSEALLPGIGGAA